MALLDTLKTGLKKVGSLFERRGQTYQAPSAPAAPAQNSQTMPVLGTPGYAAPVSTPKPPAQATIKAAVAPTVQRLQSQAATPASTPINPPSFTVDTTGPVKSSELNTSSRGAVEQKRSQLERQLADLRKPSREQLRAQEQLTQAEQALANVTAGQTARLADLQYYNPQGAFGGGVNALEGQINRESTLQAIQAQGSLSAAQSAYDRLSQARQQEIQNLQTFQQLTMPDVVGTPTVNKQTGDVTAFIQNPDGTVSAQVIGNVGADTSFDLQTVIRNEATGQAYAVGTRNGELVAEPLAGTAGVKPTAGASSVGGLPTKPLSGDAAKVYGFASTLIPELEQLKQLFRADYGGTLRGAILGTDPNVTRLIDAAADKVGRLRSGGAVNKDEEARFRSAIVRKSDLLFGSPETTLAALDRYTSEARTVLGGLEGGLAGASAAGQAPEQTADPLDALLNDLGY